MRGSDMNFVIKQLITNEVNLGRYNTVDLDHFEGFVNNRLHHNSFGESVLTFYWGFELYRFDGGFAPFFKNDITSWKHSVKALVSNSHFDWNVLKNINGEETLKIIKKELLLSIQRVGEMKKKPRGFDYARLRLEVEVIVDEYTKENMGRIDN
ncbi:MAG: hypothetical protein JWO09_1133 [Bacteroidetes bacterium]|nr:hypothetical protein [Bacteroidota bacterium]